METRKLTTRQKLYQRMSECKFLFVVYFEMLKKYILIKINN